LGPAAHLTPPQPRLLTCTFRAATAFWSRQGIQVQTLRAFHSVTRLKTVLTPVPVTVDQQTSSLIAVPIYETSPASFGIDGWPGYEQFISPGTPLPCSKSMTLMSALGHIGQDIICVCGFLPATRLRVGIAKLIVVGIRKAKKEKTKLKATIVLQKDLTGTFTGRFTPADGASKGEMSVDFYGGQVLNPQNGNNVVETGSVLVLEGHSDDA
jgi:hypothetical protein